MGLDEIHSEAPVHLGNDHLDGLVLVEHLNVSADDVGLDGQLPAVPVDQDAPSAPSISALMSSLISTPRRRIPMRARSWVPPILSTISRAIRASARRTAPSSITGMRSVLMGPGIWGRPRSAAGT
jgi:hypothetical protein